MFMGEFSHTLDKKGRVAIPAKLREGLGDSFVVTQGLDKCLFVYSLEGWEKLEKSLQTLSMARAKARAFNRIIYSSATKLEIDKQGRVIIPQKLRDHVKFKEDVVIVGVGERVEMWSEEIWDEFREVVSEDFEDIAEELELF